MTSRSMLASEARSAPRLSAGPGHGNHRLFLGFSLSFMRFWSLENPGEWNWKGILSTCILAVGIAVQIAALFRALDLRDDDEARYKVAVRYFFGGIMTVVVGVVLAIVVAA